jgi:hypothetical protein
MSVNCIGAGSSSTPRAIAKDAYLYAFAMLENYQTMYKQVIDTSAPEYVGGFGRYRHYSEPFTPDNKDIVTPNNDTPYSWAWLDLRAEPWVLSVPAVPKDRYYVCQWFDLFTHNFAYVGVRATGFDAGHYLFTGPRWQGATPPGITQAFHSETDIVGTLTRTALNGPDDVPNVKEIHSQMVLQPLSAFLKQPAPLAAAAVVFPPYDKAAASSAGFITFLNFLLQFTQPPYPSEQAMMTRFAQIGIGPGKPFDLATLDDATRQELDAGVLTRRSHRRVCSAAERNWAATTSWRGTWAPRRGSTATRTSKRGTEVMSGTAKSCLACTSPLIDCRRPSSSGLRRSIRCRIGSSMPMQRIATRLAIAPRD